MTNWTIATPFVARGRFLTELWLNSFDRLDIPRNKMHLLWLNMSKDKEQNKLLKKYFDKNRKDFKSARYITEVSKRFFNIERDCGIEDVEVLEKRNSVAETMQILSELRGKDNSMVIYEDDVIVPSNAWSHMKKIYDWDKDIYCVSGVQYTRNIDWNNGKMILVWDWREKKKWDYPQEKYDMSPKARDYNREQLTGYECVGATATGFVLYRKEFLNNHEFQANGIHGQDTHAGYCIYKQGKKLMLCWDIKCPHIGIVPETGRFKIYRSKMCTTPIHYKDGVVF